MYKVVRRVLTPNDGKPRNIRGTTSNPSNASSPHANHHCRKAGDSPWPIEAHAQKRNVAASQILLAPLALCLKTDQRTESRKSHASTPRTMNCVIPRVRMQTRSGVSRKQSFEVVLHCSSISFSFALAFFLQVVDGLFQILKREHRRDRRWHCPHKIGG